MELERLKGLTKEKGVRPLLVIAAIMLVGTAFSVSAKQALDRKAAETEESNRAADLSAITIAVDGCNDCYDVNGALQDLKAQHVNVTEERVVRYPSDEANSLIATYGIERLPTIVLTGEIEKGNIRAYFDTVSDLRSGARIWSVLRPVYVETATGKTRGRVDVTIIRDDACLECSGDVGFMNSLRNLGIATASTSVLDWKDEEADLLIRTYGIASVPAIILTDEATVYPEINAQWQTVGRTAEDGSLIAEIKMPPYRDLETRSVLGRVSITTITDETCPSCYDARVIESILRNNFGVFISSTSTVDISSSQSAALVDAYDIASVPTVIVSEDVASYENLTPAWTQVGTVEEDGTYVFRSPAAFGAYRDLATGNIVTPAVESAAPNEP